jgi:hypothetical protein
MHNYLNLAEITVQKVMSVKKLSSNFHSSFLAAVALYYPSIYRMIFSIPRLQTPSMLPSATHPPAHSSEFTVWAT